jgi:elongation factor G
VEIESEPPQRCGTATLTSPSSGEARVHRLGVKQAYAHVVLRILPVESGTGFIFEAHIARGTIPDAFMPAIEQGLRDAARLGVAPGYSVDDVRVVLDGGSYHDVDSSETAFRVATMHAFRDALARAQPRIESIGNDPGDDDPPSVAQPRQPLHPAPGGHRDAVDPRGESAAEDERAGGK